MLTTIEVVILHSFSTTKPNTRKLIKKANTKRQNKPVQFWRELE